MHLTMNVANVLAAWTSICALVSIVNKYVIAPEWPNVGRAISAVLSILPGHIGQVITDVQAIIADVKGPPAPPAPPGDTPPPAPVTPAAPPVTSRIGLAALGAVAIFALQTGAFAMTTTGCTPAQRAEISQVESTILHDIQAGKTLQQTEDDVAALVAGQAGVDAVIVFNDALALVVDAGWIPADLMQEALSWLTQIAPTVSQHRAAHQLAIPNLLDGGETK
jgi:hypothetical protein